MNVASTRVLKKSQIFSKNVKFTLTLMSKETLDFFITNSDSTLHVCMNFAFIVTCSFFFDSGWIMDNGQCDLIILSIFLINQFYHIFFFFQIHTTPRLGISRILKPEKNQNSRKFSRARCPRLKLFQFTQLKSVHN